MSGFLEKLHLYVCIIAAIVMSVVCILIGAPLYQMAAWVSLTIVVFYVIGQFVRYFLVTNVFPPQEVLMEELEEQAEEAEDEEALEDEEEDEALYDDDEEDEALYADEETEPVEDPFLDS